MTELGRLLTAMVTPYTPDGNVDNSHAGRLAAHLVRAGSHGIVVTGTTGESPLLNDEEKLELWRAVKESLGDSTVVAGAGTNDTRHSIHLAQLAEQSGADGVLAVVPYYLKPSQDGIVQHFKAIAESTTLPIIIYNVPGRVGTSMTVDTVLRCAESPNIVGLKEANGDLAHMAKITTTFTSGAWAAMGQLALHPTSPPDFSARCLKTYFAVGLPKLPTSIATSCRLPMPAS